MTLHALCGMLGSGVTGAIGEAWKSSRPLRYTAPIGLVYMSLFCQFFFDRLGACMRTFLKLVMHSLHYKFSNCRTGILL